MCLLWVSCIASIWIYIWKGVIGKIFIHKIKFLVLIYYLHIFRLLLIKDHIVILIILLLSIHLMALNGVSSTTILNRLVLVLQLHFVILRHILLHVTTRNHSSLLLMPIILIILLLSRQSVTLRRNRSLSSWLFTTAPLRAPLTLNRWPIHILLLLLVLILLTISSRYTVLSLWIHLI